MTIQDLSIPGLAQSHTSRRYHPKFPKSKLRLFLEALEKQPRLTKGLDTLHFDPFHTLPIPNTSCVEQTALYCEYHF